MEIINIQAHACVACIPIMIVIRYEFPRYSNSFTCPLGQIKLNIRILIKGASRTVNLPAESTGTTIGAIIISNGIRRSAKFNSGPP